MLVIAFLVLILASFGRCVDDNGVYTIIAPKQIRPNATYEVSLTYVVKDDAVETAPLVRLKIDDSSQKQIVSRDVHLISNATNSVALPTDGVEYYKYYHFIAEGVEGIQLKHNVSLRTETKNVSILIQTDKAIYKPADTIRFRVLVLNSKTTPAALREKDLTVFIKDAKTNRVKQWKGVTTSKGVFSGELKLSENPELGEWSIQAEINGDDETKTKSFKIEEYVLPKFETTIDSPGDLSVQDDKVRLIVRSKYTYGKYVRGKAIVSMQTAGSGADRTGNVIIKTVPMDGKAVVEFDVENELAINFDQYRRFQGFQVRAIVLEEHTGRNHSAEKLITIHKDRYHIDVRCETTYDAGIPIPIAIRITRYGDSSAVIDDETNQITLIKQGHGNKAPVYKVFELNPNGTANIALPTDRSDSSFDVKVKYLDQEKSIGYFYRRYAGSTEDWLKVNFLTKKLRLNKTITVEVVAKEPIEILHYLVISHGRIREANTVRVPRRRYQVIKFTATFDLVPSASFIAYYIENGEVRAKREELILEDKSSNFIKMKLSSGQLGAGDNVTIDIQTNPKSYVGLLAIDQSLLLLRSGNDLKREEIDNELNQYHEQARGINSGNERDFSNTGAYLLTKPDHKHAHTEHIPLHYYADRIPENAFIISAEPIQDQYDPAPMDKVEMRIRKDFPETWLWEAIDDDNFNGTTRITKTVPDTITSWTLSAFSIDPVHGLALTEIPRTLEVSQSFFVSMSLPYSVIRGEIISITLIVYNYLEQDVDAEINFANENDEFEFVGGDDANQLQRMKQTRVKSNDAAAHSFIIKPKKVGAISLKATATSALAGDAVIQILLVEPEGVPHYGNEAVLIDLRSESEFYTHRLGIDIPDEAVPDSTRIEIKCMGDLFGGTIRNLAKLIRLPSGCGEQNLLNLVPNYVILKYLNATKQLTSDAEKTAKEYIEKGYQQQLTYKHADGSFSAFGTADKNGSTWLTAFVAKSFIEATSHVDIDESVIAAAYAWLAKVQSDDGSFPEVGRVLHKDMQGRSGRGVALTAYTLIAFLKYPDERLYSRTIDRATDYIVNNFDTANNDLYTLAVVAYALQLVNHPLKTKTLDQLQSLAEYKGDQRFWSKSKDFENRKRIASKTLNIEITAYGLLAILEADRLTEGLPVLRWLLNQRNENGGFEGTQDTVVGLTALAAFAERVSAKNKDIVVTVRPGDDAVENIEIQLNDENALVLQSFEIPPSTRSVEVSARGNGFGLLQLSYRFHLNDSDNESVFALAPRLMENSNPAKVALEVCVIYNPRDIVDTESNMVVLEVSLPSGFATDTESTYALSKLDYVKRVETKNEMTVFVLYFDHLTANKSICPTFDAFRRKKVAEQKPVPVLVYDYYDSSQRARQFYTMPATTSCDICEGGDCQQLCIKGDTRRRAP